MTSRRMPRTTSSAWAWRRPRARRRAPVTPAYSPAAASSVAAIAPLISPSRPACATRRPPAIPSEVMARLPAAGQAATGLPDLFRVERGRRQEDEPLDADPIEHLPRLRLRAQPAVVEPGEHADDEPRGVAPGGRVRVPRAAHEIGELGMERLRVEAVAVPAGDGRHARAEAADDDRRRRLGPEEAVLAGPQPVKAGLLGGERGRAHVGPAGAHRDQQQVGLHDALAVESIIRAWNRKSSSERAAGCGRSPAKGRGPSKPSRATPSPRSRSTVPT